MKGDDKKAGTPGEDELRAGLEATSEVEDEEAVDAFSAGFSDETPDPEEGAGTRAGRSKKAEDSVSIGEHAEELGDETDEELEVLRSVASGDAAGDEKGEGKKASQPAKSKASDDGGSKKGEGKSKGNGSLEDENADLKKRIRGLEGRFGEVNRQLQQLTEKASKETKAAGDDAPTTKQIKAAMGDSEKMATLKAEFPEFAEALEEQLAKVPDASALKAEMQSALNEQFGVLVDSIISEAHEDWAETVVSPRYAAWIERQDEEIANLEHSKRPSDVVKLLNHYQKFEDWVEAQGDGVTNYRDEALLDLYARSDIESPSKTDLEAERRRRNAEALEAAIPATTRSRGTRPQATSVDDIFETAFKD